LDKKAWKKANKDKKTKRKKTKYIDTDEAEQRIERETGDIYDDKQREEMLKADGITAAENSRAFHT